MALTRFFEEQIRDAIITGSPISVGRGEFLAAAGEDTRNNLNIFDMARVPMPLFEEFLGEQYNASLITFTNNTDFTEYCTHLVCMSAADQPLFVIKLKNGQGLAPGDTLSIPPRTIFTENFLSLRKSPTRIFNTNILPYRGIVNVTNMFGLTGEATNSQVTSYASASDVSSLSSLVNGVTVLSGAASSTLSLSATSSAVVV